MEWFIPLALVFTGQLVLGRLTGLPKDHIIHTYTNKAGAKHDTDTQDILVFCGMCNH